MTDHFSSIATAELTSITGGVSVDDLAGAGELVHQGYTKLKEVATELDPAFKYGGRTLHRWSKHAPGLLHRWGKHI